jgi:hypothetical protein
VREWFADYHLWEAHAGTLRPLRPGEPMTEGREQLWVRRDAYSPWLLDLVFSPGGGETWVYKRDRDLERPMSEAVRNRPDGVPLQAPEITLLFKAKHRRSKDEADLDAVLPHLDDAARGWLRDALQRTQPGHPWLDQV